MKTLVAGCSKGIGREVTMALLERGQKVVGLSRTAPSISNDRFEWMECNLADRNAVNTLIRDCKFGEFQNLIYVAGTNAIKKAVEYDFEDIDEILGINLFSFMVIAGSFARSRRVGFPSSIVGVGSIWSSFGIKGRSIYGSSKGAMASFAKHLSVELVEMDCFVNVVSPGFTMTRLTEKTLVDPLIINALIRQRSGRLLNPRHIANHIISLARPINQCINGQEIFVDHGFSSYA